MPVLPLDHPEPFAATLGVMLYPGDGLDRRKARAFAAQYLAEPLRHFHEAGGRLDYETLLQITTDAGERLADLDKRWWGGTATGEIFKAFFILAHTKPALASWNNAIVITETVAGSEKVSGSRSSLWKVRSKFMSVAHLWGAWSFREREFTSKPEIGYDGYADFQSFLTEAEILRQWGQSWHPARDKAEPPLPEDVWRVPDDWQPLDRQPGWPKTGMIPDLALPETLLANLKPAGRPKRAP
jgi:hypothetical protein